MKIRVFLQGFYQNRGGVAALEYALITALIAVAMIPGLSLLGIKLSDVFSVIANRL